MPIDMPVPTVHIDRSNTNGAARFSDFLYIEMLRHLVKCYSSGVQLLATEIEDGGHVVHQAFELKSDPDTVIHTSAVRACGKTTFGVWISHGGETMLLDAANHNASLRGVAAYPEELTDLTLHAVSIKSGLMLEAMSVLQGAYIRTQAAPA